MWKIPNDFHLQGFFKPLMSSYQNYSLRFFCRKWIEPPPTEYFSRNNIQVSRWQKWPMAFGCFKSDSCESYFEKRLRKSQYRWRIHFSLLERPKLAVPQENFSVLCHHQFFLWKNFEITGFEPGRCASRCLKILQSEVINSR